MHFHIISTVQKTKLIQNKNILKVKNKEWHNLSNKNYFYIFLSFPILNGVNGANALLKAIYACISEIFCLILTSHSCVMSYTCHLIMCYIIKWIKLMIYFSIKKIILPDYFECLKKNYFKFCWVYDMSLVAIIRNINNNVLIMLIKNLGF